MVDDNPICARAFARLLRAHGVEPLVVTTAKDAIDVIESETCSRIAAALLDVMIPDTHGPELALALRSKNARARIAFISAHVSEQRVRDEILALGALFIEKTAADREVPKWADGIVAHSASRRLERILADAKSQYGFTNREVDILRAAYGSSPEYKAIAAVLGISENTVHTHVSRIRVKTGVGSLRELLQRLDADD